MSAKTLECMVGFHSECGTEYVDERKNCKCRCHKKEQQKVEAAHEEAASG